MNRSGTGQFYGTTNETILFSGVTLTDTEYAQGRVPWHFHENNYFTFILEGGMTEGNKKHVYECSAGDLIFHNWQDAHYNIASGRFTRGFHVEVSDHWFNSFDLRNKITEGSLPVGDPAIKMRMYHILKEMKLVGPDSQLSTDAILLDIFTVMAEGSKPRKSSPPLWVGKIRDILHDSNYNWSLIELATHLNVHPVHLSRDFPRYFGTTLGDYIRSIRLQRAISLMVDNELSLTEISFECGFADQSHFIRSFRSQYHTTPLRFRKMLKR